MIDARDTDGHPPGPAYGIPAGKAPHKGGKKLTVTELETQTGRKFDFVITDANGDIRLAGPMPQPYCKGLTCTPLEDGQVHIDLLELALWEYAFDRYSAALERREHAAQARRNRTRKLAAKAGAAAMPDNLALPTRAPYDHAISTLENPAAYLQPIQRAVLDGLTFENGKLYFRGMPASEANLVQYYDRTPQAVANLDLITLRGLYTAILADTEQMASDKSPQELDDMINDPNFIDHPVSFYVPSLLEKMGYGSNYNKAMAQALVNKLMSYTSILGIMQEKKLGRTFDVQLPVMQFRRYWEATNNIAFSSPYLNLLVLRILRTAIQTDDHGKPKRKKSGRPFTLPSNTYLVRSSIMKERNKRAAEVVCIIVTLIEQAGDNTPNIKFQTIIDRCPDLDNALKAATPTDRDKILRRTFSKAWELLRTQTRLTETYKNIQLPTAIPTMSMLDDVLRFPHDGKIKDGEDAADPAPD